MKRFIATMVLSLAVISAFAQYNDNFKEELATRSEEEFLINQFTKGQEQIATGGIVLSTMAVFDAVYYGILASSAKKPYADADQLYTASIIGGVVTCVGVIASLWQFASGYANVQKSKSMIRFNDNGALCITFAERRIRHKPTPSWK